MKYLSTLVLIVCCCALVNSQSVLDGGLKKTTSKGDALFADQNYPEALNAYLQEWRLGKDNPQLALKLATTYRILEEYTVAEEWYRKGIKAMETDGDSKLQFARVLASNGKYDEAKKWYENYLATNANDPVAQNQFLALKNIEQFYFDSLVYIVNLLPLNSDKGEFVSANTKDGLFYLAHSKRSEIDNQDMDIFRVKMDGLKVISQPTGLGDQINSSVIEGPAFVSGDGQKIIFTRNDMTKRKSGKRNFKLYEAKKNGNDWSEAVELKLFLEDFSVGHPALSRDGQTIYFVSDRKGGYGGADIYKSTYTGGSWSRPENLGADINTNEDELFPFLHNDRYLFFSSRGYTGLGGLDIYKVKLDEKEKRIINVGYPINSSRDDFAFLIDNTWGYGYFSSNRKGGMGSDDMYYYKINAPKSLQVSGQLIDQLQLPIENAIVQVKEKERVIGEDVTNQQGNYSINIPYGEKEYSLEMQGDAIGKHTEKLRVDSTMYSIKPRVLSVESKPVYTGIVTQKETKQPVSDARVVVTNILTGTEQTLKTNSKGRFTWPMGAKTDYEVTIKKENFFALTTKGVMDESKSNRTENFEIEEIVIGKTIELENIYYDVGKVSVGEDSQPLLGKLVKLLHDNQEIHIELSSHTDARGNDKTNLELSQKRAQAVVDFVVANGIDGNRIIPKGYGETKLLNKCGNGINCTEEEHQLNRRTEFQVTHIK